MKPGPRWWHHLRAHLGGYFWLPCPACGRFFGGHEWPTFGPSLPTDRPGIYTLTCGHRDCPSWFLQQRLVSDE